MLHHAIDRCQPFFSKLQKATKAKFDWVFECKAAFQELKKHLMEPPLLTKPQDGETLFVYLSITNFSVSSALIVVRDHAQYPAYYVSRVLHDAETQYTLIERMIFALVTTSHRLRHYFQDHSVTMITPHMIKLAIVSPDILGE